MYCLLVHCWIKFWSFIFTSDMPIGPVELLMPSICYEIYCFVPLLPILWSCVGPSPYTEGNGWTPEHSEITGDKRANAAAKSATRKQEEYVLIARTV